jgi:hypothetical protein
MQLFINNWAATLTAPATSGDLTLSVDPAQAAKLVGLGEVSHYLLTLAEVVDGQETAWEIVKVTASSGGVLTVQRGQEGTAASAWSVGASISARATAGTLEELRDSGGGTGPELSDSLPLALGAASAGTGSNASREDHRHPLPTAADIGAATAAQGVLASTAVQPSALTSGLDGKVDKVPGKGLSEEDFTTALRSKLVAIEPAAFRGVFASLAALQAGVSAPQPGDFADVDAGVGSDVVRYIWDATDSEWQTGTGGGGPASTDSLPEGATNLYHTPARVRQTPLTGISFVDSALVAATDTVLQAIGKLAARLATAFNRDNHTGTQAISTVSGLQSALDAKQATLVSGTNIKTLNGDSLLGAGNIELLGGGAPLAVVQALTSSRALALADANTFNINSTANAYTATIPAQATVAWAADTEIHFLRSGAGAITLTAAAGVSINGVVAASVTMNVQHGAATLKRVGLNAWWLGGLVASAAEQRVALGLGNAATATVQTAGDDATAGRVLTVGAGGLLTSTPPQESVDLNARVTAQFLRVSSTAANRPAWAGGVATGAFVMPGGTSSRCTQFHSLDSATSGPRIGVRNQNNAGFSDWAEFWHTANLTPNRLESFTLSTLPAAAANARLQVYVSNLAGQPAPVFSDGTNWRRVSDNTIAN